MEPIIAPVSVDLLKAELTPIKKLRDTNKARNEIYIVTHHDSPNVMREIGRLREEAFRDSGGGSGLSMDIDEFDTMENPYKQLIVWDPEARRYYEGRVNEEEMREIWRMTGLEKWEDLLEGFLVKKTGVLLDIVLKGGNFGVYSKDRENVSHARWVRKMQTFRSLAGNVRFAFRYAPREWFWMIVQLLGGQFR